MDEYIKREDALKAVTYNGLNDPTLIVSLTLLVAQKKIRKIPAADVVEVVRCKNCTEWDEKKQECSHWYGFRENDFCSYGERKAQE